jgi:hypothetical protein
MQTHTVATAWARADANPRLAGIAPAAPAPHRSPSEGVGPQARKARGETLPLSVPAGVAVAARGGEGVAEAAVGGAEGDCEGECEALPAAEALRLDGSLAEARALLASAEGTRA